MTQSLEYTTKISYKHVNNNHKKLKYSQIKELKELDTHLTTLLENIKQAFDQRSFEQIGTILQSKEELFNLVSDKITAQISRTRTEESSPKNTTLYFSLLTESKDLLSAIMKLLESYYEEHDDSIEPAKIEP